MKAKPEPPNGAGTVQLAQLPLGARQLLLPLRQRATLLSLGGAAARLRHPDELLRLLELRLQLRDLRRASGHHTVEPLWVRSVPL